MKIYRKRQNVSQRRSGQAPLELVLLLPTLVAMFLIILTVGSVGFSHASVAIQGHQATWEQRHDLNQTGLGLQGTREMSLVLKPNSLDRADSGLMTGKAEIPLQSFLPRLLDTLLPAEHTERQLSTTWDHRVIDFEEEDDHDPLELGKRVVEFKGQQQMKNSFKILAGMTGGSVNGAAVLATATQLVPSSEGTNDAGIVTLTEKLARKVAELTAELSRPWPNFAKINRLRREIQKLRKQIATIKKANQNLNKSF